MKRSAIAAFCLMAFFGAAPRAEAHGFSFGFGFGYGSPHGFYVPYAYYPAYAYVVPPAYCPPVYAPGIYFPGSALGLRYYVPYHNYTVYRGYIPRYRYYYRYRRDPGPYIPRRYYRRTFFRD